MQILYLMPGVSMSIIHYRIPDSSGQLLDDDKISSVTNLDTSTWGHIEITLWGPNYSIIAGTINSVSG